MEIFFAVVVVVSIAAWGIVRSDELSGLGRSVRMGSFRHPHGRLVAVSCEGALPEKEPWARRFRRFVPWVTAAIILVASAVGVLANQVLLVQMVAGSVLSPAMVAFEGMLRQGDDKRRFAAFMAALIFGMAAGMIAVVPLTLLRMAGVELAMPLLVFLRIALSVVGYAVGAAAAMAALGARVKFLRTFEDGVQNSVEVSTNSAAYGAFVRLMKAAEKKTAAKKAAAKK